ncbi:hypothetical protein LJC68_09430 [Bacteroidales bacterium OttesenSCG-928-B11]|nr:hypothetical protein [Bacteroidales bacterium OttesenSCG-928-C03]MDL2313083.1 hypothetical protein [Bacteroidales bacterium OttesenSCG-928-B11]
MSIEYIENGMELSKVREIFNEVIAKINSMGEVTNSYNDLKDKPAIDGVELSGKSSMKEFNIEVSQLPDAEELEKLFIEVAEKKAEEVAKNATSGKLDADYGALKKLEYNINEGMTVAICTPEGEIFQTSLDNLVLYLKHAILKIDDQYLRVIK